jgi:hypothetical protein
MTKTLAVGDLVKYAAPEAGEESERFLVLELRGERVLLGMVGFESWTIPPTCARLAADMVAADE